MSEKRDSMVTSLRIPLTINQLWEDLSQKMSINKTATLVTAIRTLAKIEGVEERPITEEKEATA